jgi:nitrite reductase/ring-hydroxylating ferredoxin subunit
MSRFVKVETTSVFNNITGGKLVNAGGQEIAVFKLGEEYYAIENTCPHAGGPLGEGEVGGDVVTCPWHASRFNIKTGEVVTPPARQGVKSFPVRIMGSDIEVEIE